jgi:hypothetical protein
MIEWNVNHANEYDIYWKQKIRMSIYFFKRIEIEWKCKIIMLNRMILA